MASPQVLILAAAALLLTNVPFAVSGSRSQPDYFWPSLGVLLALWQIWR